MNCDIYLDLFIRVAEKNNEDINCNSRKFCHQKLKLKVAINQFKKREIKKKNNEK